MGESSKVARLLQSEREACRSRSTTGERLKLTRDLLGKNQTTFATGAGIARNTYNQFERGKCLPSVNQAHKICDRWGLTFDWIFRGDTRGLSPDLCCGN